MTESGATEDRSASELIDERIAELAQPFPDLRNSGVIGSKEEHHLEAGVEGTPGNVRGRPTHRACSTNRDRHGFA